MGNLKAYDLVNGSSNNILLFDNGYEMTTKEFCQQAVIAVKLMEASLQLRQLKLLKR